MSKTLLEKMFLKPEYAVAILNAPEDLTGKLKPKQKEDSAIKSQYNFILAFYTKEQQVKEVIIQIKSALLPQGLLWIAYPKNKALDTDLNRDILHELMKEYGFDGVFLVSLNTTWSALRFKVF